MDRSKVLVILRTSEFWKHFINVFICKCSAEQVTSLWLQAVTKLRRKNFSVNWSLEVTIKRLSEHRSGHIQRIFSNRAILASYLPHICLILASSSGPAGFHFQEELPGCHCDQVLVLFALMIIAMLQSNQAGRCELLYLLESRTGWNKHFHEHYLLKIIIVCH